MIGRQLGERMSQPLAEVHTVIHRARGPAPRATAVVLPGFLDSIDHDATRSLAEALATSGITAVRMNPRGSWEPGARPSDHSVTRHLADLRDLVGQLRDGPAERTVLVGHCYGGYLAALAATRDLRVTDVVALMPTRSLIWFEDYDSRRDDWDRDGEHSFLRADPDGELREFRVPHSVVEDSRRHDLPAALRELRQRILFVAGRQDEVVMVEAVCRLHAECGSGRKDLTVLPVQHDYRDRPDEIAMVNQVVIDWLA